MHRWARAVVALVAAFGLVACKGGSSTPKSAPPVTFQPRAVATDEELAAVPSAIPDVEHGTLLKYVSVPDEVEGATTYRIMYVSQTIDAKKVVVTGFAIVPDTPAAKGSRVIFTNAHGTAGFGDQCTPSLVARREFSAVLGPVVVANNWVLTASDYEGLGTPGTHPYLVGVTEGRNVLDAALAAAQLPNANTGNKLLIGGYSQGGHAALWANQIAAKWTPRFDVLGTYAGAPVTEIERILEAGRTQPWQAIVLSIITGFAAAYPDAVPSRYLTPAGLALLPAAAKTCIGDIAAASDPIAPADLVRANGVSDVSWQLLARRNNPGALPTAGPTLIVHSAQDEVIPAELSRILHERMCKNDQVVERRVIDAGRHAPAGRDSFAAALAWFQRLVAGGAPVNDCIV